MPRNHAVIVLFLSGCLLATACRSGDSINGPSATDSNATTHSEGSADEADDQWGACTGAGGIQDSTVIALDPSNGETVWMSTTPWGEDGVAAFDDVVVVRGECAPGKNRFVGLDSTTGTELWVSEVEAFNHYQAFSRVGDTLIVDTPNGTVSAIATSTGEPLWRAQGRVVTFQGHKPRSSPPLLVSDEGWLRKIDLATGTLAWEVELGVQEVEAGGPKLITWVSAVDDDGQILASVANTDERLMIFLLDGATGESLWTWAPERSDAKIGMMQFGAGTVIVPLSLHDGSGDGRIVALDSVNGSLIWDATWPGRDLFGRTWIIDDAVIAAVDDGLIALALSDGSVLQSNDVGWVNDLVLIPSDPTVAIFQSGWGVTAIDREFEPIFEWEYGDYNGVETLAAIDGLIVAATGDFSTFAVTSIDGETGEVRWQAELDRKIQFPAQSTSGALILLTADDEDFGDY